MIAPHDVFVAVAAAVICLLAYLVGIVLFYLIREHFEDRRDIREFEQRRALFLEQLEASVKSRRNQ